MSRERGHRGLSRAPWGSSGDPHTSSFLPPSPSDNNQMCQGPAAGTRLTTHPHQVLAWLRGFQQVSTVLLSGPQFINLKRGLDTPYVSCAGHR